MSEPQVPPAFSFADIPVQDADWRPSTRYEVLERWLKSPQVRQIMVRDTVTGQIISLTDFYEGP